MHELRVTGFGGQGIIRTGMIIGKALSLHGGMHATLTQSFGPEARGSACSAQVVVDDKPVTYPYITGIDYLIAMSQEGYSKSRKELRPTGTLVYESELVVTDEPPDRKMYGVPATRIAEELGVKIAANLVMIGFFTGVTELATIEAVKAAIPGTVPGRFLQLNLRALDEGYQYGKKLLAEAGAVPAGEEK